jgi:solute carrier family 25, member 39/40
MATLHTRGQRHDRIELDSGDDGSGHPPPPNYAPPVRTMEAETSVTQKMMSATIGSVLTSLLGTFEQLVFLMRF